MLGVWSVCRCILWGWRRAEERWMTWKVTCIWENTISAFGKNYWNGSTEDPFELQQIAMKTSKLINKSDCRLLHSHNRLQSYCFVSRPRSTENKYMGLRAFTDNEHPDWGMYPEAFWELSHWQNRNQIKEAGKKYDLQRHGETETQTDW